MKILYIVFHGFSNVSGISKKIRNQIEGLKAAGHKVSLACFTVTSDGQKMWEIEHTTLVNYGRGRKATLRSKTDYRAIVNYARKEKIDLVYTRSFHNANPFTIWLFHALRKAGIKNAMEIPTYPYDQEYEGFPPKERMLLAIDKCFRKELVRQVDAIVTFSDYSSIFGQRTIQISNGINFNNIPVKTSHKEASGIIHLIGVAEVHYWHGYDRLIAGLGKYYNHPHDQIVFFHIIGGIGPSEMYNSDKAPGFNELIYKYKLRPYVLFYGQLFGKPLDTLFEQADFAIGSLARHRSGIDKIKTLKNREYAARGIPFCYSETDEDFDQQPYILKIPADESPVDIEEIVRFCDQHEFEPEEIRNSVRHLSWEKQMQKVIEQI